MTYNPKKAQIYRNLIKSCNHIERRIFQRKQRKVVVNALNSIKTLEARLLDFQDKYRDEIDLLLDLIYPPSENENSDTAQINETSGTTNNEHRSNESKDSQYTNSRDPVNYLKGAEEFLGNPPSIFLQTPSKKSRKSMTESIFHESDEEGNSEERSKGHSKTAGEKTIIDMEMENDNDRNEEEDDEEEEFEEESEKKITSTYKNPSVTNTEKRHSDKERQSDKESARVVTMTQNLSRGQRKLFMEMGERMASERDTFHVLQNFEKMYRVNNNVNTLTANQTFTTGSGKKNVNSYIGSYTKSNSSSYPKKLMAKSSSSSFNSAINRRTPYNDYVSRPLFAFDFDRPKEFKGFLPHNNLEQVLRKAHIDGLLKKVRNNNNNTFGRMRNSKTNKQSHGGTSNMANTSLSTTNKKKECGEEDEN